MNEKHDSTADVRLERMVSAMRDAGIDLDVDTMHDVYMTTEQRAAFDRLRKDAERYRWLREHELTVSRINLVFSDQSDLLDAMIDTAMQGANA